MGSKYNLILRGIYGFPKHIHVIHMVELLSFILFLFIPHGKYPKISSSEMISSCQRLNIIDGKLNKFSRKIFRGNREIRVMKVYLILNTIYGPELGYI